MRKLEIADAEVVRVAVQQEIQRTRESRYQHRLHGLLLVTCGRTCSEVAELFGEDRRTVQRWVAAFQQRGLEGLVDGRRPGRPRSLTPEQWKSVEQDLRGAPGDFGLVGHDWDGRLLSEHLRRSHGVKLGVRQCQRLFGEMGMRLRKPRPQLAQSEPDRVEAFKKTAPSGQPRGP